VNYRLERTRVEHHLDETRARPLTNPRAFQLELAAERYVEVDDTTRALARKVAGGEANPFGQARRIYDHVIGAMEYDAGQQSWKGSTEHALVCSVGNCNDIHALLISLCRSLGIPARLVLGQAFEPPEPGEEECDLCGYHCWAEFFVAGLGWLPADASCACKYDRHGLFGQLEMNHVAWSIGRDLTLSPAQNGEPVLFLADPYAELDGAPFGTVQRSIGFTDQGSA